MRVHVDVRRRQVAAPAGVVGSAGVRCTSSGGLGPVVVRVELERPRVLGRAGAVLEPVADHELQPGRDQRVARGRGSSSSRVISRRLTVRGLGSSRFVLVGPGVRDRHVAAEPGAGHPHRRVGQVVPAAVDGALGLELSGPTPAPRRRSRTAVARCRAGCARAARCGSRPGRPARAAWAGAASRACGRPGREGVVRPPEEVEVEGPVGGALRAGRVRHGHSSAPSVGPLVKSGKGAGGYVCVGPDRGIDSGPGHQRRISGARCWRSSVVSPAERDTDHVDWSWSVASRLLRLLWRSCPQAGNPLVSGLGYLG